MRHSKEYDRTKLMSWNIQSGGFNSYDPTLDKPERETLISSFIHEAHTNSDVENVTLPDAYRWDELYGGNEGIATHLGYASARFIRLEDERLERNNGAGIGIAFATDRRIEQSEPLDLDTRQGLRVVLALGYYGLQVASVYLDDLSEETRVNQVRALHANLIPDMPTILTGDFNALRQDMDGASFADRAKDIAIRSLARVLASRGDVGVSITNMNKRQVVPLLNSLGYQDADNKKRPTAPSMLPAFGVDYVFHNDRVELSNFDVLRTKSSDHSAIVVDISNSKVGIR